MKIMHVLQSPFFSGAENVACQIIEMFRDSEYEMAYCSPDGPIREAMEKRGIRFIPLAAINVRNLRKAIRCYKPDIIHAHDRKASICAAIACGLPVVSHIHVNNPHVGRFDAKSWIYSLFGYRFKHIFWVSKSAFVDFPYMRESMRKKSTVLYNVIDIEKLKRRAAEDEQSYSFDAVMVGRLNDQKDPIRALRVIKKVISMNDSARFGIVGAGPLENQVAEELKKEEYKGRVRYLGYMDNPLKVLRDAKALLMTSRFEGTPMTVLEAMALGVPVVSTPVDGILDLIRDGENGYLSNDDDVLAEKLNELIKNSELREKLSAQSGRTAEKLMDIWAYKEKLAAVYSGCR